MKTSQNKESEQRGVPISTPPKIAVTKPTVEQQWLAAWRFASQQLPRIQRRELANLTDVQGTRQATWLGVVVLPPALPNSGLAEWQRLMMRSRSANGN